MAVHSNDTPRAKPVESPTEPFKRAVAGCMRAIAGEPDLEVTFAADRPSCRGNKARLPEPPRKLTANDVAVTRGLGDSLALRLACHDPAVHRAHAPTARTPAPSSTPSSRRASRRSAPTAWRASPTTSRRCSRSATTAATTTRSPSAPTRRSRTPSR